MLSFACGVRVSRHVFIAVGVVSSLGKGLVLEGLF